MKRAGLTPAGTETLTEGLLLAYEGRDAGPALRITHVFKASVYVMAYTTPEGARGARKPHPMNCHDVEADLKAHRAGLFRAELPDEMHRTHPVQKKNEEARKEELDVPEQTVDVVWGWIAPLVKKFGVESNLERVQFKALIQKRADELGMSFTTVRRMLLRFYYFGRVREGLVPLVSGPSPGTGTTRGSDKPVRRRRGRQCVLAERLGKNTFVASETDVAEMIQAVKRCARKKSDLESAHDQYMKHEFVKRHPDVYADFLNKRCVLPVTERQFSMYVKAHAAYKKEVLDNIPALAANTPGSSVHASGAGEIYEVDATGGRVDVVGKDASGEPVLLYRPWIYLMIDRWSRFIVSVYVTLGAPSWEELKYVLLLAFTPRVARFRCLSIEVDERRWPPGSIPFAIGHDRGSEFQSIANLKASVEHLRIESLTMPPMTPNARLIERAIREIKRNMARSGLRGVFAERPLDPKKKRTAKNAQRAAASSLQEVYRCLLKVVDEHNNKPHSALKRNLQLIRAGVPPTPAKAYVWGREHITGSRVSSLTEKDLMRMLLSTGRGSIAKGRLKFEKRTYEPVDREALALAAHSTARPKSIEVRYDKTFREELYMVTSTGQWSKWRMVDADRQQTKGVLKEEEEALEQRGKIAWATAKNDSKIERLSAKSTKTARARQPARHGSRQETQARRRGQTRKLKEELTGRKPAELDSAVAPKSESHRTSWRDLEKAERLKVVTRTTQRGDS